MCFISSIVFSNEQKYEIKPFTQIEIRISAYFILLMLFMSFSILQYFQSHLKVCFAESILSFSRCTQ